MDSMDMITNDETKNYTIFITISIFFKDIL